MTSGKKTAIWAVVLLGGVATTLYLVERHHLRAVTINGAVLQMNTDTNKQVPIADVQVTASNSLGSGKAVTDAAGYFTLTLPKGLRRKQQVLLQFRRQGYQSLDVNDYISDKIYVEHMTPTLTEKPRSDANRPNMTITNARVRYSVKTTTEADVGSAVKTFQVSNAGNVPCRKQPPCSPDGKWKAGIGTTFLDAGEGNQFRNARASCIAGPCPFTRIETENLSEEGRRFNVSVRNWSDTTTFLLEAEVVHPMISDLVRESYPVVFGRALNFSLPGAAEGLSMEAELNGQAIVFPLGPDLLLRWADCHMKIDKDQSRNFRCELKPGYEFR